jgi:SpoIID/LytB domain protein
MHRRFWGLLVAAIVLSPVASARATVPVVIIEGRGWGHGVGMAQDGAFWMAKAGATTPQILGQFYPGASIGKAGGGVAVNVFNGAAITVAFPAGGRIDASGERGFPIKVEPGGRVHLVWSNGRIVADELSSARPTAAPTTTTVASTTTTLPLQPHTTGLLPSATTTTAPRAVATESATPSSSPAAEPAPAPPSSARPLTLVPADASTTTLIERNRTYRGIVTATPTATAMRLVNQLDVEQYLRGMGEVRDPSWPAAALRTQAVAARTYALRAMSVGGELCDTTRCQVYLGAQAEYGAMDKAVAATSGQVLMFNHALASAVYSANAGGQTASPEEGFGTTGRGYPYLRSARYDTQNPMPWTVTIGLEDLSNHLGRIAVTSVAVATTGPSGRALTVTADGPDGPKAIPGRAFAAALGLRSTMFTVRMGTADVAPPPIAGGSVLQLPPEELVTDAASTDAALTDQALAPTRVELPDRGLRRVLGVPLLPRTSTPLALFELLLALVAILAVSLRPRGSVARIRSWRGARPPEDDRR